MKIKVSRYQGEYLLGLGLALLAYGGYCWTLSPSVVPGNSALAFVSVLNADPVYQLVGHPLWHISARLFSLIPFGDVPWRLNMFSALCGAGVVFFLFRLVTLILYDVMSEEHWIKQIDEELPEGDAGGLEDESGKINATGYRIAMAGGVVSALAFAFCTPLWQASTSLHYQTFELLLILSTGYAMVRYCATASMFHLVLAVFLLGLGIVEAVSMLLLLPFSLLIILIGAHRHGHISLPFMGVLVLCCALGALLAIGAQVVWITQGGMSTPALIKIGTLWFKSHAEGLSSIMARKGWLLIFAQGLLPLLIAYSLRNRFAYDHLLGTKVDFTQEHEDRDPEANRGHVTTLFWGMLLLILLAAVAHGLLNLPGSPCYFARGSAYLPVLPLLGIAMTLGFLFAYALLFGNRYLPLPAKSEDDVLPGLPSRLARAMSGGLAVVICVLVVVTVSKNSGKLDGQQAGFVDLLCREILKAAPEARCFVTDGMLDMNLRVQARLMKREITLLNGRELGSPSPSVSGVAGAKGPTTSEFLSGWLSGHPEACSQLAVLTAPRVWFDANYQAIPSTLVYLGTKPDVVVDLKALLKGQLLFWKTNRALFEEDLSSSRLLSHLQSKMRIHISRLANDLGVLCLHRDAQEEAREAFALALEIEPNNLCAWMNQCAPEPRNAQTKSGHPTEQVLERITAVSKGAPAFGSLADWETHYGALFLPAVEHIANRCNKGTGNEDSEQYCLVSHQSREYVRAAIHAKAEPRLPRPLPKDISIDEEVIRVVEALAGGYSKAAESQVRNVLRKRRTNLAAWSLLAEALMNQKNFAEVQNIVLPEMRFIAGAKGSEWIEMTEGCLALRQEKPDYQFAHEHFMGVLKDKPDIEEAQNLLIQTALLLGDTVLLEAACNEVLKNSPRQPMANAALGALRLNQSRFVDAEKALSVSIAARPSSLAFNDLGEALRQMKKLEAAEAATRRALILDAGCYQAWDTLALILSDAGRVEEAADAHRAALRLCQTDIRLYLAAAHFEQVRGDFKAVRQLLEESAPLLAHASTCYKDKYNNLLKSLPQ